MLKRDPILSSLSMMRTGFIIYSLSVDAMATSKESAFYAKEKMLPRLQLFWKGTHVVIKTPAALISFQRL